MKRLRPHIAPIAWLALVAMLALALLPMLTHALAHQRGDGGALVEICTPQGMKHVALDATDAPGDAGEPARLLGHLDHCAYCALAGATPLPAPPAGAALAVLPLTQAAPVLFLHAPRTLFAWAAAQPRGPPSRS